jgi:hypothetical protein
MWKDLKNLYKAFYVLFKHLFESLGNLLVWAIRFFGPVADSAKGVINAEEFYRVLVVSMSASGGLYGSVDYMSHHVNEYVSDPVVVTGLLTFIEHVHNKKITMAVFTLVFILEYTRRKYSHGVKVDHQ